MKISVIIAAAGAGKRFGSDIPKQYVKINGVTVLEKTLNAFSCFDDIVISTDNPEFVSELLNNSPYVRSNQNVTIVAGGAERQDSVYNALCMVSGDYVLIHDAARPFVASQIIKNVTEALDRYSAVIPCVKPKSTVRTADKTLNRDELFEVQTPQGFKTDELLRAYEYIRNAGIKVTDDAGAFERYMQFLGAKPPFVHITEGDYSNIKITTREDVAKEMRVGNGYDVHRFALGRPLMLGCANIPFEQGLLGHSDADVLSHAIADALLGAAALGDIGHIFPDSAKETEGMAGSEILSRTAELVRKAGYEISMVDSTVIAEAPKLAKYIMLMRENTAKALGISVVNVSIKATTEEGLGQRSREGIAAMATAVLK